MDRTKDYYKILGINFDADSNAIKYVYRTLARKYHPDVNPGNKICEEKFKEIGEAYSVLIDENKRRQYDYLRGIKQAEPKKSTSQQTKKQAEKAYSTKKEKPQQEQKSFNDVFSEFFDGVFKKNSASSQNTTSKKPDYTASPERGDDITTDISVSITEAHNGTTRKINILRTETCLRCKGKRYTDGAACLACDGQGEVSTHKKLNVKIPANVKEGAKIRIPKEGNKGQNGGDDGDLFLLVHILKNSAFVYEGLNVLCEIPITPSEAALGADIEVPAIDGHISMKIPNETKSGQKFRLSGQGIADSETGKKGDHIVTVRIELPPDLSEKEKQLYRELARIRKFNPRESILYE